MKAVSLVLPVNIHVFKEFGESKDPKILLKGSDRMLMLAATLLGLVVEVKSIVSAKDFDDNYDIQECLYHSQFHYEVANKEANLEFKYSWKKWFSRNGYKSAEGIIWCHEFKQKVPGFVAPDFGFEVECEGTETLYMAAAILVSVPTWSDRSPLHDIDEECTNGQSEPTSKRAAKRKKTETTNKMKKREK